MGEFPVRSISSINDCEVLFFIDIDGSSKTCSLTGDFDGEVITDLLSFITVNKIDTSKIIPIKNTRLVFILSILYILTSS